MVIFILSFSSQKVFTFNRFHSGITNEYNVEENKDKMIMRDKRMKREREKEIRKFSSFLVVHVGRKMISNILLPLNCISIISLSTLCYTSLSISIHFLLLSSTLSFIISILILIIFNEMIFIFSSCFTVYPLSLEKQ